MREKALATPSGPGHRLWEVKFGHAPRAGHVPRQGASKPARRCSWTPEEVKAGQLEVTDADGSTRVDHLGGVAARAGLVQARLGHRPTRTAARSPTRSNVLDPTWEAPDGTIMPLDGFLDPYFQEVYLEADSIPLFSRLVKELGADAVDDYVEQLEHEVWKYTVEDPELRQGRAAHVQRLPADRAATRRRPTCASCSTSR